MSPRSIPVLISGCRAARVEPIGRWQLSRASSRPRRNAAGTFGSGLVLSEFLPRVSKHRGTTSAPGASFLCDVCSESQRSAVRCPITEHARL